MLFAHSIIFPIPAIPAITNDHNSVRFRTPAMSVITISIAPPIEIASGCFSTAILLKFRTFLIILIKQIYMVALKVLRKLPRIWAIIEITIQDTRYNEMLPENVLSKSTKNRAKIHCQINKFHWDSRYIDNIDPMKRISPQVLTFLTIICHF